MTEVAEVKEELLKFLDDSKKYFRGDISEKEFLEKHPLEKEVVMKKGPIIKDEPVAKNQREIVIERFERIIKGRIDSQISAYKKRIEQEIKGFSNASVKELIEGLSNHELSLTAFQIVLFRVVNNKELFKQFPQIIFDESMGTVIINQPEDLIKPILEYFRKISPLLKKLSVKKVADVTLLLTQILVTYSLIYFKEKNMEKSRQEYKSFINDLKDKVFETVFKNVKRSSPSTETAKQYRNYVNKLKKDLRKIDEETIKFGLEKMDELFKEINEALEKEMAESAVRELKRVIKNDFSLLMNELKIIESMAVLNKYVKDLTKGLLNDDIKTIGKRIIELETIYRLLSTGFISIKMPPVHFNKRIRKEMAKQYEANTWLKINLVKVVDLVNYFINYVNLILKGDGESVKNLKSLFIRINKYELNEPPRLDDEELNQSFKQLFEAQELLKRLCNQYHTLTGFFLKTTKKANEMTETRIGRLKGMRFLFKKPSKHVFSNFYSRLLKQKDKKIINSLKGIKALTRDSSKVINDNLELLSKIKENDLFKEVRQKDYEYTDFGVIINKLVPMREKLSRISQQLRASA